jgi:P-type conjugative transfer ATPase TrbB
MDCVNLSLETPMFKDDRVIDRRTNALKYALGETVMDALNDPDVVEVMLNDDGTLWLESNGQMRCAGTVSASDAMAILNNVSSALNGEISKENPIVEGELPLNGERFEGVAPPVVERGVFAIRKKAGKIYPLADYVRVGVLSFKQAELLRTAVATRQNILVVGGTGSGKTTFCNALLNELSILSPGCRMHLLEDTQELQCALSNRVFFRTTEWTDMARLSIMVTRMRPDSITVGEIRSGGPALALLKLWNTGHPGGMTTIHANSAYEGLIRLDQLIQEVSSNPQLVLIGQAVNVVVFLQRDQGSRKIKEIIRVKEYDPIQHKFIIEDVV